MRFRVFKNLNKNQTVRTYYYNRNQSVEKSY